MQPQDLVYVIREFIDRKGNRYPARKDPYQYGEIPVYVRDNKDFVVAVEQVTIETKLLHAEDTIKLLIVPETTKELKPVVVSSVAVEKEVVALPEITEIVAPEVSEEVTEPTKTTTRKRK